MSESEIDSYARSAHTLVDNVIESALKKLQHEHWDREKTKESINFDMSRNSTFVYQEPKFEDFEVKNITWLTIEQFSPQKAEDKLHEFIKVRIIFTLDRICNKWNLERQRLSISQLWKA